MDYHSSLPYQDSDQMRERDNSDHEDQEVNNRQSVIKFKDVGEEDDLEREVRKNVYNIFVFPPQHPGKIDLNKKRFPKQKTNQNFNIDAQGFRKTRNENPSTWEIGVTS